MAKFTKTTLAVVAAAAATSTVLSEVPTGVAATVDVTSAADGTGVRSGVEDTTGRGEGASSASDDGSSSSSEQDVVAPLGDSVNINKVARDSRLRGRGGKGKTAKKASIAKPEIMLHAPWPEKAVAASAPRYSGLRVKHPEARHKIGGEAAESGQAPLYDAAVAQNNKAAGDAYKAVSKAAAGKQKEKEQQVAQKALDEDTADVAARNAAAGRLAKIGRGVRGLVRDIAAEDEHELRTLADEKIKAESEKRAQKAEKIREKGTAPVAVDEDFAFTGQAIEVPAGQTAPLTNAEWLQMAEQERADVDAIGFSDFDADALAEAFGEGRGEEIGELFNQYALADAEHGKKVYAEAARMAGGRRVKGGVEGGKSYMRRAAGLMGYKQDYAPTAGETAAETKFEQGRTTHTIEGFVTKKASRSTRKLQPYESPRHGEGMTIEHRYDWKEDYNTEKEVARRAARDASGGFPFTFLSEGKLEPVDEAADDDVKQREREIRAPGKKLAEAAAAKAGDHTQHREVNDAVKVGDFNVFDDLVMDEFIVTEESKSTEETAAGKRADAEERMPWDTKTTPSERANENFFLALAASKAMAQEAHDEWLNDYEAYASQARSEKFSDAEKFDQDHRGNYKTAKKHANSKVLFESAAGAKPKTAEAGMVGRVFGYGGPMPSKNDAIKKEVSDDVFDTAGRVADMKAQKSPATMLGQGIRLLNSDAENAEEQYKRARENGDAPIKWWEDAYKKEYAEGTNGMAQAQAASGKITAHLRDNMVRQKAAKLAAHAARKEEIDAEKENIGAMKNVLAEAFAREDDRASAKLEKPGMFGKLYQGARGLVRGKEVLEREHAAAVEEMRQKKQQERAAAGEEAMMKGTTVRDDDFAFSGEALYYNVQPQTADFARELVDRRATRIAKRARGNAARADLKQKHAYSERIQAAARAKQHAFTAFNPQGQRVLFTDENGDVAPATVLRALDRPHQYEIQIDGEEPRAAFAIVIDGEKNASIKMRFASDSDEFRLYEHSYKLVHAKEQKYQDALKAELRMKAENEAKEAQMKADGKSKAELQAKYDKLFGEKVGERGQALKAKDVEIRRLQTEHAAAAAQQLQRRQLFSLTLRQAEEQTAAAAQQLRQAVEQKASALARVQELEQLSDPAAAAEQVRKAEQEKLDALASAAALSEALQQKEIELAAEKAKALNAGGSSEEMQKSLEDKQKAIDDLQEEKRVIEAKIRVIVVAGPGSEETQKELEQKQKAIDDLEADKLKIEEELKALRAKTGGKITFSFSSTILASICGVSALLIAVLSCIVYKRMSAAAAKKAVAAAEAIDADADDLEAGAGSFCEDDDEEANLLTKGGEIVMCK